MKKYVMATTFLIGLGASSAAFADDDGCRVAMADWQPKDAVQAMAEAKGWTVRRIKIDDGCYEIKGTDAAGREIEVKIDPASLLVVEMEFEDGDYDDDDHGYDDEHDDDDDDGRGPTAAPAGSVAPPENGLFTPGTAPVVEK